VWDTGQHLADLTFGAEAERRFGAPYLLMHRGDLHAALFSAVPPELIAYERKLVDLEPRAGSVTLRFADGGTATADAVVGADGVHSRVREILLGPEKPKFTGRVAHRTVYPAALMKGPAIDTCTKWWGPDRHIVIYPVNPRLDEIYFVTSVPDPNWDVESWSARGETAEVLAAMAGFHEEVQRVVAAAPGVHKWALFERDPLARWADGPVVLLGDACHPMTPYMAQGAASALEDAAVLSRCLADTGDPATAFRRYEATRLERTARIQLTSRQNTWGKQPTDSSWVYGHDVWQTPLAGTQAEPVAT
jgi:salicylate hydroxylase/6-hydroxynicotinate 3-monooxygenase